MKKLIIALFLMIVILPMAMSVSVSAETYSGTCGEGLIWEYDTSTYVLTVSGSGEMDDYKDTMVPWVEHISTIRTLVIGDSVTSIGDYAFDDCEYLSDVTFGSSVESIGVRAFHGTRVWGIKLPASVKSIGAGAFPVSDWTICTLVYEGTEEQWYEVDVELENYELMYTVIYIPQSTVYLGKCGEDLTWRLDEEGVFEVSGSGGMYDYSLYVMDIPWFDLTDRIDKVIIGDSVTRIGKDAFFYSGMRELIIGESVTHIATEAFYKCVVSRVYIPASVTKIDSWAFYGCGNLEDIYYGGTPDQWDAIEIGDNNTALADANLHYVNLKLQGECGDGLTWSFNMNKGILNILGEGDMYDYDTASGNTMPWQDLKRFIRSVVIGDSVTGIGNAAFYGCENITDISLGSAVTSIGSEAFYGCCGFEDIDIPVSVTAIGSYAFYNCTALSTVTYDSSAFRWAKLDIGEFNDPLTTAEMNFSIDEGMCGDSLTWRYDSRTGALDILGEGDMYDYEYKNNVSPWSVYAAEIKTLTVGPSVTGIGRCAFVNHSSITSVSISGSVEWIGVDAFQGCRAIEDIYITDIAAWCGIEFFGRLSNPMTYCENFCLNGEKVTELIIPGSVTEIGNYAFDSFGDLVTVVISDSVTAIEDNAFYNCDALCELTIGNSVETIGMSAFSDCNSLRSVVIPDSVKTIGNSAFALCESLEQITLGSSLEIIDNYAFEDCFALTSVVIPDSVHTIGKWAFTYCTSLGEISVSDSVTSIGADAFYNTAYYNDSSNWTDGVLYIDRHFIRADEELSGAYDIRQGTLTVADEAFLSCSAVTKVYIPESVIWIGDNSFVGCKDVVIRCYPGSYAHSYAVDHGLRCEVICDHIFTDYIPDNNATCGSDGTRTAYCDKGCGVTDSIPDEGTATGDHRYGDWVVTAKATYLTEGEKTRYCLYCDTTETQKTPTLTLEVSVDNYTVTVNCAEHIRDMRYALGEYTTASEIKNAEGNVALSNAIIQKYTKDGIFTYEMPDGGYYTVWIRMTDGSEYILALDVTHIEAAVTSDGVTVTLHDLYNVRDFFIAKGEYTTYREIKDNGYIVSISGAKIGTKHDYTYTVYEPGMHTVLVRYNDGTSVLFHEILTVDEPVFAVNGLQVTVSNLPDVKVIRTAYGEWNTTKELKATDTIRNFPAAIIKGADQYTVQYREEGRVTMIVEYNNGYTKAFHCDIQRKVPTVEQNGNTVIFGDLDGLNVIRYAKGEYTSSEQIKHAPDSKVVSPASIYNGYIILSLESGTYTFCVQYDDESYNYYSIVI